jgi:peptide chain release factor 3
MAAEFGAKITLERLPYTVARAIDPDDVALVAKQVSMEVLTRTDGVMLALFTTKWRMQGFCEDNPEVRLRSLVAAGEN